MSSASPISRRVACPRCGASFDCCLSDVCWCARQPIGLPVPEAGNDANCLCPDCLKAAAAAARPEAPPTH